MTAKDASTSTIPCLVKHVRACANLSMDARFARFELELVRLANREIKFLEGKNLSILRRIGLLKKLDVPTVDALVDMWRKQYEDDELPYMSGQWWVFCATHTDWWKTLEALCDLPEEMDNDIMHLSIEDAKMINFNVHIQEVIK